MKTICRNTPGAAEDNVSLYLFSDETLVTIEADKTIIGDLENPECIILDCNTSNVFFYENVSDPGDYFGWKYTYTPETDWVLYEGWAEIQPQPVDLNLNQSTGE